MAALTVKMLIRPPLGRSVLRFYVCARPYQIVIEIVRRGDLDAAGTKFGVDVFVGDDWNLASGQWQFEEFTQQIRIAFIVGVHRYCTVA